MAQPDDPNAKAMLLEERAFLSGQLDRYPRPTREGIGELLDALRALGVPFPAHPAAWTPEKAHGCQTALLLACRSIAELLGQQASHPVQLLLLRHCVGPTTPLLRAETRSMMAAAEVDAGDFEQAKRHVRFAAELSPSVHLPGMLATIRRHEQRARSRERIFGPFSNMVWPL